MRNNYRLIALRDLGVSYTDEQILGYSARLLSVGLNEDEAYKAIYEASLHEGRFGEAYSTELLETTTRMFELDFARKQALKKVQFTPPAQQRVSPHPSGLNRADRRARGIR